MALQRLVYKQGKILSGLDLFTGNYLDLSVKVIVHLKGSLIDIHSVLSPYDNYLYSYAQQVGVY